MTAVRSRKVRVVCVFVWLAFLGVVSAAVELPPHLVAALGAEKFGDRQNAERELLAWCRGQRAEAMEAIYQQSRTAAEAEVRGRCGSVLRMLVLDDYDKDGSGYLGVQMNFVTELVVVPGAANPELGIRIDRVEENTPAAKAGIQAGDMLLGINDRRWKEGETLNGVTGFIKAFKPGSKVTVRMLREGKVLDVPVVLGKRPALADAPELLFLGGARPDAELYEAAENAAREAYFQAWLNRRSGKETPP